MKHFSVFRNGGQKGPCLECGDDRVRATVTDIVEAIVIISQSEYSFVLLYRMLPVGSRGENSISVTSDDTASIYGERMGDSKTGRGAVGGRETTIVSTEYNQWQRWIMVGILRVPDSDSRWTCWSGRQSRLASSMSRCSRNHADNVCLWSGSIGKS